MGKLLKKKQKKAAVEAGAPAAEPVLARRSANRHSSIKSGRTIGGEREHLETANERMAARQKDKRKKHTRVFFVTMGFLALAAILVVIYYMFFYEPDTLVVSTEDTPIYTPTVEIVDEDAAASGGNITTRMRNYIGQAEADYRSLGYRPVKAVIPVGAIREVDFYLDGQPGYIKMYIDRPTAESVEDADRMLRYLADQGTEEFEYIDIRIPYKAYWK